MICTRCGSLQPPHRVLPGSGWIELVLWLFALLPGIIYSIWRRSSTTPPRCPSCGSRELVDLASPVGRKLADQHHPGAAPRQLRPLPPVPAPARSLPHRALRGVGLALSGVLLVGVALYHWA